MPNPQNLVKYNQVPIYKLDGFTFRGKKEVREYQTLCLRKKAGKIYDFKVKPCIQFWFDGNQIFHAWADKVKVPKDSLFFSYRPDFVIYNEAGLPVEMVETKGWKTDLWKFKEKIIRRFVPIPLTVK